MSDATSEVRRWLLVVCFFVCPLIFFTNLTRNPYITQITLMHGGIAFALALWAWSASGRSEGWLVPRLPPAAPPHPGPIFLPWLASPVPDFGLNFTPGPGPCVSPKTPGLVMTVAPNPRVPAALENRDVRCSIQNAC